MSDSLYAAPQAELAIPQSGDLAEAEAMRKAYLPHEASMRSVGLLYLLGTVALLLVGLGALLPGLSSGDAAGIGVGIGVFAVCVGIAALYAYVGVSIRKLKPSSRIWVGIFSGIGLLAFPVGTLINAYILYLFFSQKGKTVLSPEYAGVVIQTPHVKYKTSIIIWIGLALVLLIIIGGALAAIGSR